MTEPHPLEQRIATVIHDDLTTHQGRRDGGLLGIVPRLTEAVLAELQPELDALVALRAVSRGYCPACGRGDAAPTVHDWEQQKQRADRAEAEIAACRRQQWPQQLARAEEAIRAAQRVARGIGAWGVLQAINEALHPQPAPAATQTTDHHYLSTGCLHGDTVLPDGRTGHQYCQSDTGKAGAKTPAQCKFCQAPCTCPCHIEEQPDA